MNKFSRKVSTVVFIAARWTALAVLLVPLFGCASIRKALDGGVVKSDLNGHPEIDFEAVKQLTRVDCGAACLAFVLPQWGNDYTLKQIEAELPSPGRFGYSLAQLQSFAASKGLFAFLFSGTVDDLRKQTALGRPCIIVYQVNQDANHAVVVTGLIDGGTSDPKFLVMDPGKNKISTVKQKWIEPRWKALQSPILLVGM